MKNLLKIFLISSSLYACNNMAGDQDVNNEAEPKTDTLAAPDPKAGNSNSGNRSASFPDPADFENETIRQITSALLSSQQEIVMLRSEISESLSKPGLTDENEILFRKTILQLEKSSNLINKQLEQILVEDLDKNREKLNGIVKNMRTSEKELGSMITRLDKISSYMQVASGLIQTLVRLPSTPAPPPKNAK